VHNFSGMGKIRIYGLAALSPTLSLYLSSSIKTITILDLFH
jgi:hypothetical protein